MGVEISATKTINGFRTRFQLSHSPASFNANHCRPIAQSKTDQDRYVLGRGCRKNPRTLYTRSQSRSVRLNGRLHIQGIVRHEPSQRVRLRQRQGQEDVDPRRGPAFLFIPQQEGIYDVPLESHDLELTPKNIKRQELILTRFLRGLVAVSRSPVVYNGDGSPVFSQVANAMKRCGAGNLSTTGAGWFVSFLSWVAVLKVCAKCGEHFSRLELETSKAMRK
ncbi:uncharacterized protein BDZ99DRAFT_190205 [Mytilinidion resinicola]|uniref:Uncharacterized protein n=1 Tax=Mytilinidion resinicola TaxID=574789 RepID=A0A6A6Z4I6_9PEZI|nr:uncharacterized protein BDZ99DRAFT_190205 [Mytilinidion resinicola]KAF2815085.1 hypothetical protein BDZ99DRAFT_190205 [Mytilinidion resinicola]